MSVTWGDNVQVPAWPDLSLDRKACELAKQQLGPDALLSLEGRALAQRIKDMLKGLDNGTRQVVQSS